MLIKNLWEKYKQKVISDNDKVKARYIHVSFKITQINTAWGYTKSTIFETKDIDEALDKINNLSRRPFMIDGPEDPALEVFYNDTRILCYNSAFVKKKEWVNSDIKKRLKYVADV